jgi:hypothetical protein
LERGGTDTTIGEPAAIKFEIDVRYNNGDVIHGTFQTKEAAIRFLGRPTA